MYINMSAVTCDFCRTILLIPAPGVDITTEEFAAKVLRHEDACPNKGGGVQSVPTPRKGTGSDLRIDGH